jgi:type VI secretion system protein VasI
VFLALRCIENKTDVVIGTDQFTMMQESVNVITRMGDNPATTTQWEVSTNSRSVGLWSGAQAIPFIKSLQDNKG